MPEEVITIRTVFIDKISGKIKRVTDTVQQLGDTSKRITTTTSELTSKGLRPLEKKVTTMTGNFRKFRMELLSVMFGAQMVAGAMWGILQPAMQAAGVFELLSTMMLVLFLPIALAMIDPLVELLNWFVSLPEPLKEFIGAVVLFLVAFMTFLATQAAVDLFFGGMLKNFEAMGGMLPGLTAELEKFSKLAAIGVGVYFAKETLDDLREGKYLDAAVDGLLSGLSFAYALGKIEGKTAILIAVGAYFAGETIKDIKDGKWMNAIGDALMASGAFLMFKMPYAGAALIAICFTLKYVDTGTIKSGVNKFIDGLTGSNVSGRPNRLGEKMKSVLGSNQMGGYIPHTGLYKLHAGETVQQAGASAFNANIVINASSNVDVQMLKSQLSSQWNDELKRMSRG